MASRFGDINLTRYDDLFRTEEERQTDQQERRRSDQRDLPRVGAKRQRLEGEGVAAQRHAALAEPRAQGQTGADPTDTTKGADYHSLERKHL